jgi:hypothetical protein
MMERGNDWERWQRQWQRPAAASNSVAAARQRLARGRRELFVTQLLEMSVAAAALLLVALALLHAASAFEAALGLVVGAAICVAWLMRNVVRKREEASLTASSAEHLDIMGTVRLQHLLLVRLVWIVMALDLVFLIPWWIGGRTVHPIALTNVDSWIGIWLPMAGLVALFFWSLRLWRHTRRELGAIDRVRSEPDEE